MLRNAKNSFGKNCSDLGILLIRFGVGFIFLFAGLQKLIGIDGPIGSFTGIFGATLAPLLAWMVAIIEFVGGIALLLGIVPRIFAFLLSIIMLVALISVLMPAMFTAMAEGATFIQAFSRIQLGLMLLLASLGIALIGPGKFSLEHYLKIKWKY